MRGDGGKRIGQGTEERGVMRRVKQKEMRRRGSLKTPKTKPKTKMQGGGVVVCVCVKGNVVRMYVACGGSTRQVCTVECSKATQRQRGKIGDNGKSPNHAATQHVGVCVTLQVPTLHVQSPAHRTLNNEQWKFERMQVTTTNLAPTAPRSAAHANQNTTKWMDGEDDGW